jgi:hypothetical protein
MKNRYWLFFLSFFILMACQKESQQEDAGLLPEDPGCIQRLVVPVIAHSLNSADLTVVTQLFAQNNINIQSFRFYKYEHDSLQTAFPPFAKLDRKIVRVDQYANGLRILTGEMVYNFSNDVLLVKGNNLNTGIPLDTVSAVRLSQLRGLFLKHSQAFVRWGVADFKDSCLVAEFGYFDLNAGSGNPTEVFVKAWRVSPKANGFPVGYYKDDGRLIYYFDGIQTFK